MWPCNFSFYGKMRNVELSFELLKSLKSNDYKSKKHKLSRDKDSRECVHMVTGNDHQCHFLSEQPLAWHPPPHSWAGAHRCVGDGSPKRVRGRAGVASCPGLWLLAARRLSQSACLPPGGPSPHSSRLTLWSPDFLKATGTNAASEGLHLLPQAASLLGVWCSLLSPRGQRGLARCISPA